MLNITYKDRRTNIWVRDRTKVIDIMYTVRKMKWYWAGHISRLKDPMDLACHHLKIIYDKKRSQAVERRPGQILVRHDMAEDCTRQGNLEMAC